MYEFGIYNKKTNEREVIFGYNYANACAGAKIEPAEWTVDYVEYVD